jgi:hypothetical protein
VLALNDQGERGWLLKDEWDKGEDAVELEEETAFGPALGGAVKASGAWDQTTGV